MKWILLSLFSFFMFICLIQLSLKKAFVDDDIRAVTFAPEYPKEGQGEFNGLLKNYLTKYAKNLDGRGCDNSVYFPDYEGGDITITLKSGDGQKQAVFFVAPTFDTTEYRGKTVCMDYNEIQKLITATVKNEQLPTETAIANNEELVWNDYASSFIVIMLAVIFESFSSNLMDTFKGNNFLFMMVFCCIINAVLIVFLSWKLIRNTRRLVATAAAVETTLCKHDDEFVYAEQLFDEENYDSTLLINISLHASNDE